MTVVRAELSAAWAGELTAESFGRPHHLGAVRAGGSLLAARPHELALRDMQPLDVLCLALCLALLLRAISTLSPDEIELDDEDDDAGAP